MISRDEAVAKAKAYVQEQPWVSEVDGESARVIESNECINILFRYRETHKPPELMIGVDKKSGVLELIKLG